MNDYDKPIIIWPGQPGNQQTQSQQPQIILIPNPGMGPAASAPPGQPGGQWVWHPDRPQIPEMPKQEAEHVIDIKPEAPRSDRSGDMFIIFLVGAILLMVAMIGGF